MGRNMTSKTCPFLFTNYSQVQWPIRRERGREGAHHRRKMVGAVRFELTTSCTRNKRASQATLRPDKGRKRCRLVTPIATKIFLLSTIASPWSFPSHLRFTIYD